MIIFNVFQQKITYPKKSHPQCHSRKQNFQTHYSLHYSSNFLSKI